MACGDPVPTPLQILNGPNNWTFTSINIDNVMEDDLAVDIIREIISLASTDLIKVGYKRVINDAWGNYSFKKYELFDNLDNRITSFGTVSISSTHILFYPPEMIWPDSLLGLAVELSDPQAIEKIAQHIKSRYPIINKPKWNWNKIIYTIMWICAISSLICWGITWYLWDKPNYEYTIIHDNRTSH